MSDDLVVFENVQKSFDKFVAVKEMNFAIGKGEFVAIMGPSGCGKTTTLRMLAGLETPTRGEIRLDGSDRLALAHHHRAARVGGWQGRGDQPPHRHQRGNERR